MSLGVEKFIWRILPRLEKVENGNWEIGGSFFLTCWPVVPLACSGLATIRRLATMEFNLLLSAVLRPPTSPPSIMEPLTVLMTLFRGGQAFRTG